MNGTEEENGSNGKATARTKRVLSKEFDLVANGATPAKDATTTSNGGGIDGNVDKIDDGGDNDDRENDSSSSEAFASTKSEDDDASGEETEESRSAASPPAIDAAERRGGGGGWGGGGGGDGSIDLCPALLRLSLLVGVAYLGSMRLVLNGSDLDPADYGGVGAALRHAALCLAGALLIMAVKSALLVRIVLPALLPVGKGGGGVLGRLRRLIKFALGFAMLCLLLLCDWVLVTECMDEVNGGEMLK